MALERITEHISDSDHPSVAGQVQRRIQNWQSYRTPVGLYLATDNDIETQNDAPPDWGGGAYDFSEARLRGPLQVFFRDRTDAANRAMWGVRLSRRPGAWLNWKALGVDNGGADPVVAGNVRTWVDLWTNVDLRLEVRPHAIAKTIVLKAAPHQATFRFALRLPVGFSYVQVGDVLSIRDANNDEVILTRPLWGLDANGTSIRVALVEAAPIVVGGHSLPTFRVVPNATDLASAVYPVEIDPTTTISGTTDITDTFMQLSSPDVNFGTNTYIQVGVFTGEWVSLVAMATSAIPSGTYTGFRFFGRSTQARLETANIYRVNNSRAWGEVTATWNKYDGTNNWTTGGCASSGNDYRADASPPQWVCTGTNQYYTSTLVSSWCSDWKDGIVENNGIVFRDVSGTFERIFSSENATNQLYFEVDYSTSAIPVSYMHYAKMRA